MRACSIMKRMKSNKIVVEGTELPSLSLILTLAGLWELIFYTKVQYWPTQLICLLDIALWSASTTIYPKYDPEDMRLFVEEKDSKRVAGPICAYA